MPKLVRLYIRHCLIGYGLSALFVGLIFWFNIGNLWHLVSTSDVGLMATVVFVILNGTVFAGVQFAFAVMSMAEKPQDKGGNGPGLVAADPVVVPVASRGGRGTGDGTARTVSGY